MESVNVGSGLMNNKNQDTNKTGGIYGNKEAQQTVQNNEFIIDRSEYQQVFRVFDSNNTGEISINQVYDLINKFDNSQTEVKGGSNIQTYQQSTGAAGQGQGKYGQSRPGVGTKSYAQGTTSSQLYQNGQYVLGAKKQGSNAGVSSGYNQRMNGMTSDNSKMSSPNRPTGTNNQQESRISNGQIGANPRLSNKNKPINSQIPGSSNQGNYQQSNKEKSPRRGSQLQGLEADQNDESPGIKNSRLKPGSTSYNQGTGQNNSQQITSSSTPPVMEFPNGKESLQFEEFIDVIKESCSDTIMAENYLVLAFSMFDRQKKGYISKDDLKQVFETLGESITDEEVNTMVKIAGIKSNDKINFKEFVDFFYKID